ncbi:ferric reductase-like transmembrane domain-containing protein [Nocardioides aestuarii]|uniref:Ferredoxin reductase family protein n=1 Tax=Nocardioides aestuarii TaxID=252231 RepID=A0ABW4TRJ7_9ACTN
MTTTGIPTAPLLSWSGARARRDAAVRTAAGAVLWGALLLVTWWWAAGGGVVDLAGWVTGITSLGRVTGLVASVLLLAQVWLMVRLPLLERAFGQDRLARIHRVTGFTSFTLMLAHIALVTWGYAGGSLPASPAMLWELTWSYPAMLLAVAGTAALVTVVVTSLRAARSRLRYESWHLLHLYAYLGAGLALPHQLWTGQELVSSPARAAFWWTAWGATAAAVLVWRVGLPLARSRRHRLVVSHVVPEAPGVVSVHLTGRRLHHLGAEPGQFLTWRFLGRRGWTRANPYSLSAAPDGRSLRITVQDVGDGSGSLATLRPGTTVLAEGPHGRLSPRARTRRKVALIGAGVGMAPIRSLAEGLPYAPGDAVVLHRYTDHRLFGHELDALAGRRGLQVVPLPGRRRHGASWIGDGVPPGVSDLAALQFWVPDLADRDVFLCGPPAWTDLVRDDLLRAGLPPERLHLETFRW